MGPNEVGSKSLSLYLQASVPSLFPKSPAPLSIHTRGGEVSARGSAGWLELWLVTAPPNLELLLGSSSFTPCMALPGEVTWLRVPAGDGAPGRRFRHGCVGRFWRRICWGTGGFGVVLSAARVGRMAPSSSPCLGVVLRGPRCGDILLWQCCGSVGRHCDPQCGDVLLWGCRGSIECHYGH